MISLLLAAALLGASPHPTPAAPRPGAPAPRMTSDAECIAAALSPPRAPLAFAPGELLEFDLDALGAQAGKLTLSVRGLKDGLLPVDATAQTNSFFAKIRRVSGGGTSYLDPKTLRPVRYSEDTLENDLHREARVDFRPESRSMHVEWKQNGKGAGSDFRFAHDGLDMVGAVALLRQQPWAIGKKVCFDAYAIRRLWRVTGKVETREHVSLPIGEFEAWHLSGVAVRLDNPAMRREIHLWISDDAKRLPLAAVGMIDLGAVRATLSKYVRPWERQRATAAAKESLKF